MGTKIKKSHNVSLLMVIFIVIGCHSYIDIDRPATDKQLLATPNTFLVDHDGCGEGIDNSISAWIDEGTEISHKFEFNESLDQWLSQPIEFTQGQHTLAATAEIEGWCYPVEKSDKREFIVVDIPNRPVKIMLMGDSITRGQWETSRSKCMFGYRYKLYKLLKQRYSDVPLEMFDFVGRKRDPITNPEHEEDCDGVLTEEFDREHEGHPDIRSAGFIPNTAIYPREPIDVMLTDNDPDLVLLHIGTNNVRYNVSIDDTVEPINFILNYIYNHNPNIVVFLALIIDQSPTNIKVTELNNKIRNLAIGRINNGDKIILVDMENDAGLIADDYDDDGIHLKISGYEKMAMLWFRYLDKFLPVE